ncbi:MAG: hypothetical protein BJBARM5_0563 [Candidatus Parvarchaeum acidophilus ARMAN-5]|jgi:hypothetical protein|uniref:Uncharacterized protein n=1 Tax=Candidatus Parvarchaeum acidophilus ARMAN-5 TaxID=662762 RepID=D6GVQ0_PARA5|nr:MAG: hypothetical protein BJBARM5_0563 [Candidatus Parvarchaeum acidophilus ARMAN-5]
MKNKGITEFLSFILSIIILIPIAVIAYFIITAGANKVVSSSESASLYVSTTISAMQTGQSVVLPPDSPNLPEYTFLSQFYGNSACMSDINQLSREAVLVSPSNPSTLSNKYFVCIGTYNPSAIVSSQSIWLTVPKTGSDNASFPSWFPNAGNYNSRTSSLASGINGSTGTLSYFTNPQNVQNTLAQSCVSFFNATTKNYGYGQPGAYITTMTCVPLTYNNNTAFINVIPPSCSGACGSNPVAFLYGNPGYIKLQECSYSGGNELQCKFTIN